MIKCHCTSLWIRRTGLWYSVLSLNPLTHYHTYRLFDCLVEEYAIKPGLGYECIRCYSNLAFTSRPIMLDR